MSTQSVRKRFPTAAHWGNYVVEVEGDKLVAVHDYADDAHASPIGQSLLDVMDPNCRIDQPMIRQSYLKHGCDSDGSKRGREAFVAVPWDEALDIAAAALQEVKTRYGNTAIYAGSYGWASAGRFHHAQSQLHRFMNQFGGYTASDRTYSAAAGEVLLPHVLGADLFTLFLHTPPWKDVISDGQLVISFGGIPTKNLQVAMGGVGSHTAPEQLRQCREAGVEFVNISPVRTDIPDYVEPQWIPLRPNTDTALMLALCHTIASDDLVDHAFLERYTIGYQRFERYLMGADDGQAKDADWAAAITDVPAAAIRALAKRMARQRTFVTMGWCLQRAEHGEQPYWAAVALLAMLGQIGLKAAGVGHGVGSIHTVGFMGRRVMPFKWGKLPQGANPVDALIPVARISDLLLHPGEPFDYDGKTLSYPDIKLVYWAGGNPFHQHQDLNRLRQAWARPETIIINEPFWTASARHADIVFPITTSLERNDVGFNTFDPYVTPMPQAIPPYAHARNDYDVFSALAARLGFAAGFTEGRDEMQWVREIFADSRRNAAQHNVVLPDFETFWQGDHFSVADQVPEIELLLEAFRRDPQAHPLGTPSGKIEIYSETVAGFAYADCPGFPIWLEKVEYLGAPLATQFPLHLISGQPTPRLHSQLDHAALSRAAKIKEREPVTLHPETAAERGIVDGQIVRIFNARGACLAGARFSAAMRKDVLQLATGAWYDPIDTDDGLGLCAHGNPNVLTRDVGTSRLGQGPSAHSCLVEIEPYTGPDVPVRAFTQPEIIRGRRD